MKEQKRYSHDIFFKCLITPSVGISSDQYRKRIAL